MRAPPREPLLARRLLAAGCSNSNGAGEAMGGEATAGTGVVAGTGGGGAMGGEAVASTGGGEPWPSEK